MEFRTKYSKRYAGAITLHGPSRTKQSFKRECDINVIVARVKRGEAELPEDSAQRFADVSDFPDYLEMRNRIARADEMFEALPAKIRRNLGNDPSRLVELASTQDGLKQLRAMGFKFESEALPGPAAPAPTKANASSASPSGEASLEASKPRGSASGKRSESRSESE